MLFESSIVRIDSGADVCGTGFVISDSLVLTCAHVVCNDKGYLLPALRIVFHHAPGESAREVVVEEQWWRAPNGEDIAVLRIEPPAPPGVTPALLAASAWHGESEGETFGFPKVGKINGVHGRGQVLGALQEIGGRRLLQIDSKEITSGFSGAPFVDTKRRRVIGMVTEIVQPDEHGRLQRLAILTPTETLIEVCPFLQPSDACPYRGLLPFSDADEDLFFGRERLISELTEHLRSHSSLLVLVGSSGSGKSSVIAAGVVPRLRRGRVQRFRAATIVSCRPGMRAEESIRHALLSAGVRVDPDFEQGVRSWTGGRSEPRLVLVIDQFEEVFAHEANGETSALLAKLVALTQQPGVTVILIIRADFYESLLHSPFGDRLENAQVNVRPMTAEEQQEAIVSPARALGLTLSDNLTTLIQRDLERVQHPLPLLEFALTELWHGRTDGELTASEYERIGGVAGSIGQWATTAFESLSLEMRDLARQIFTRLVHYGIDGLPDSRRRLPLAALLDDPVRDAHVQELIGRLAKARLIVIDRDERTGEDVVEIIHDALLREWRQLASWVRDQRAFLVWRQALQLAVATWERHGRSADWLLRGGTLTEASRWLEEHRSELGSSEIRLIEASEQEQEGERRRWKAAYDRALTRHLVSQAELIRTQQPSLLERSVLIALEALRRAPSAEAMMALRLGLELLPVPEGMIDCGEQATQFVFSSDGNYVALLVGGVAIYQLAGKAPRLVLRRVCNLREVVFENDATRVTVLDS